MSAKELREIDVLASDGAAKATEGVLVTLVRADGSSYRRPGARLLALADGRTAGTISGGCLEADLLRRAQWRVRAGAAMQSYDTGFDDTSEIPFGLGCGGRVDLLLESLDAPETAAMLTALRASLRGESRSVLTQLPIAGRPLARLVMDERGDVLFASETLPTDEVVTLRDVLMGRGERADVFVEHLQPAQRLVIFGAGEDARPLSRIAAELGWTVVVADGRPHMATAARFPQAHIVCVAEAIADAGVTADDAVVLMTHSFEQDGRLLGELLRLPLRYLGLLGARQRSALLLRAAAAAAGVSFEEAVERTHAPIGLYLGGDGPESIALAIVAEVQATLQGMQAGARSMNTAEAVLLLERFAEMPVAHCALQDAVAGAAE